jgi:hypothetical protein
VAVPPKESHARFPRYIRREIDIVNLRTLSSSNRPAERDKIRPYFIEADMTGHEGACRVSAETSNRCSTS